MDTFHIYVHFPANPSAKINSPKEGVDYIKKVQMLIDRSDCEKGAVIYFDNESRYAFFSELKTLEDKDLLGYLGAFRYEEVINYLIFESGASNWEEKPIHQQGYVYTEWITSQSVPNNNFPSVLKEITEREILNKERKNEKCLLLNIDNAYSTSSNPISMIRGDYTQCCLEKINCVSDFVGLDNWFLARRSQRIYNLADNRHIENHPNYARGKSPLIGGQGGKTNAASLLENALGDKRKNSYLINFDPASNRYIRYEDERSQNQYHGYHLVKPVSYDIDEEAQKDISKRIIELLAYRKSFGII